MSTVRQRLLCLFALALVALGALAPLRLFAETAPNTLEARLSAIPLGTVQFADAPVAEVLKALENICRKNALAVPFELKWSVQLTPDQLAAVCTADLLDANLAEVVRGLCLACGLHCEFADNTLWISDAAANVATAPLALRLFRVVPSFWELVRQPVSGAATVPAAASSPAGQGASTPVSAEDVKAFLMTCGLPLSRDSSCQPNEAKGLLQVTAAPAVIEAVGRLLRALRVTPSRTVFTATAFETLSPTVSVPDGARAAEFANWLAQAEAAKTVRRLVTQRVEFQNGQDATVEVPMPGAAGFAARLALTRPAVGVSLRVATLDFNWRCRAATAPELAYEQAAHLTLETEEAVVIRLSGVPAPWHPGGGAFLALAYRAEDLDGGDYAADGVILPAVPPLFPEKRAALQAKLNAIKLPKIEFEAASVYQVLARLRALIRENDPEQLGVPLFLVASPDPAAATAPPAPAVTPKADDEDSEPVASTPVPATPGKRTITMSMKDIPAGEIIRYVCMGAGLRYTVGGGAVWVMDRNSALENMDLRSHALAAGVFDGADDDKRQESPPGPDTLRELFLSCGVWFPPGASVRTWPLGTDLVFASRNTPANQKKIEEVLGEIGTPHPCNYKLRVRQVEGAMSALVPRPPSAVPQVPGTGEGAGATKVLFDAELVVAPVTGDGFAHSFVPPAIPGAQVPTALAAAIEVDGGGNASQVALKISAAPPTAAVQTPKNSGAAVSPLLLWDATLKLELDHPLELAAGGSAAAPRYWILELVRVSPLINLALTPANSATPESSAASEKAPPPPVLPELWAALEQVRLPDFVLRAASVEDAKDQLDVALAATPFHGRPLTIETYLDLEPETNEHGKPNAITKKSEPEPNAPLAIGFVQRAPATHAGIFRLILGDPEPVVPGADGGAPAAAILHVDLHNVSAAAVLRSLGLILGRALLVDEEEAVLLPNRRVPKPVRWTNTHLRFNSMGREQLGEEHAQLLILAFMSLGNELLEAREVEQASYWCGTNSLWLKTAARDWQAIDSAARDLVLTPPQLRTEVRPVAGDPAPQQIVTQLDAPALLHLPDTVRPDGGARLTVTPSMPVFGERFRVRYEIADIPAPAAAVSVVTGTLELTGDQAVMLDGRWQLCVAQVDARGIEVASLPAMGVAALAQRNARYQERLKADTAALPATPLVHEFRVRKATLATAVDQLRKALRASGLPAHLSNLVLVNASRPELIPDTRAEIELVDKPLAEVLAALSTAFGCRFYLEPDLLVVQPAPRSVSRVLSVSSELMPRYAHQAAAKPDKPVEAAADAGTDSESQDAGEEPDVYVREMLKKRGIEVPEGVRLRHLPAFDALRISGPGPAVEQLAAAIQRADIARPNVECELGLEPESAGGGVAEAAATPAPTWRGVTVVGEWLTFKAPGLPAGELALRPVRDAQSGKLSVALRWGSAEKPAAPETVLPEVLPGTAVTVEVPTALRVGPAAAGARVRLTLTGPPVAVP